VPRSVHFGEANPLLRVFRISRSNQQLSFPVERTCGSQKRAAGIWFCVEMELKSEIPSEHQ